MTVFVAKRLINNGPNQIFQPGDEIPGFETWPEVPKRSLLNLGWVEKVIKLPEPSFQAQPEVKAPQKTPKKKSK